MELKILDCRLYEVQVSRNNSADIQNRSRPIASNI